VLIKLQRLRSLFMAWNLERVYTIELYKL
jgi:hypothetical protein